MVVGPDAVSTDEIGIKDFEGGLYAVARCKLPQIGPAWQKLVAWRADSHYHCAPHQCLEGAVSPQGTPFENMVMDIYLAIAE